MYLDQFLYPFMLLGSTTVSAVIAVYSWRRRSGVPGAGAFALHSLAQSGITLGFLFELLSPTLGAKLFWDNVQWVGWCVAPLALLAFAFDYTDRKLPHPWRTYTLLSLPAAAATLLLFTNNMHGLAMGPAWIEPRAPFPELVYDFSPLILGLSTYLYGIVLAVCALLAIKFIRARSLYRIQIAVIMLGAIIPTAGTLLTLAGFSLGPYRDMSPFTFVVAKLIIAWGLFRYRLFDIVPVARDLVVESISDIVFVVDAQGRVIDLNPAALRIVDVPLREAIGALAIDLFADQRTLVERYQDVDEARDEIVLDTARGKMYYDMQLSPVRDRWGRLTGRVVALRDVTRLRQREREARTLAEMAALVSGTLELEKVFELTTDYALEILGLDCCLIAVYDDEGRTLRCGAAKGFPPEVSRALWADELTFTTRTVETVLKGLRPLIIDSLEDDQYAGQDEVAFLGLHSVLVVPLEAGGKGMGLMILGTRSGRPRRFDEQYTQLALGIAGQAAMAAESAKLYAATLRFTEELESMVLQRTADLENAYKRLEILDRGKSDFIQVISHELRTPLSLIKGYSELLKSVQGEDEVVRQCVRGIATGTSRLHEIVDSMLDAIELESPTLTLALEPVLLPSLFDSLVSDLATAFSERGLKLAVDDMDSLPEIEADRELLSKLFDHLLTNAIKYTPDGGSITITGKMLDSSVPSERCVEVVVSDTGIGIAPEFQDLVFAKFYRTGEVAVYSSGKTKFKGGGPGLGLAIARGVVQAHDGRIWVESPGSDEVACPGTQVHVLLPIVQPQRKGAAA